MTRVISLAFVWATISFVPLGLGQTAPTTAPAAVEAAEVRPFTLLLRVIDKETREPLAGVRVRFIAIAADDAKPFGEKGATDDVGLYAFAMPSNKMRHLGTAIRLPGYIPMGIRWTGTLPPDFTLELERGVPIGGKVVDDAGAPVVGAKVTLTVDRDGGQSNAGFDIAGDWVMTTAGGTWTYDRAPADFTSATVSVSDPRYVSGDGATIAEVKPDDALARRLVLTLRHGLTVAGTVVDADGQPLEGVAVRTVYAAGVSGPTVEATTDREGKFQLTVEGGSTARLRIKKDGFALQMADLPTTQAPDSPRITLTPAK